MPQIQEAAFDNPHQGFVIFECGNCRYFRERNVRQVKELAVSGGKGAPPA
jgi:hypothetical protein